MRKSCSSIANFKRPSLVEVKMNESSNNNPRISNSDFLSKKLTFGTRLGAVWQDLQDEPHWEYEQLSPVQLLEKSKLPRNSTDIDELARANWFWSRRPRFFRAASCIVWLIAALGDPHSKDRVPTPISLLKIFRRLGTVYRLSRERYRQRRQLMEMDDRQLKDIGITREQAEQEARKPIWKG